MAAGVRCRGPLPLLATGALVVAGLVGGPTPALGRTAGLPTAPAGAAMAGTAGVRAAPDQDGDGDEGRDDGERTVPIERRVSELARRVEPYDGSLVTRAGDGVRVSLDGDVLFDFDTATLTAAAEATLTGLAATIDRDSTGDTVVVTGHTDDSGDDAYNLDLSLRRAGAVRDFLQARVTTPVQFVVDGKGEAEPVAPNRNPDGSDNPEGRRHNRRVEVSFPADLAAAGSG